MIPDVSDSVIFLNTLNVFPFFTTSLSIFQLKSILTWITWYRFIKIQLLNINLFCQKHQNLGLNLKKSRQPPNNLNIKWEQVRGFCTKT